MLKLVQNEYIKLLKKKSSWVILILVAVIAIGFCALFTWSMSNTYYDDVSRASLQDEANYYLNEEYYKQYLEKNADGTYVYTDENAKSTRQQMVFYQFIYDNKLEYTDWRYSADIVTNLCYAKYLSVDGETAEERAEALSEYNTLKAVFDADDWKAYYNEHMAQIRDTYKDDEISLEANLWFYDYSIKNNIKPGEITWKDTVLQTASVAKISLIPYLNKEAAGEVVDSNSMEELLNTAAIAVYRLDHNIEIDVSSEMDGNSYGFDTMWGVFNQSKSLVTVIGVLIIVVAGSIVAGEFAQGTIKFLLINPVKRWKILVSKYITAVSYGLALMLMLYAICGIFSMIFTGFNGVGAKMIIAENGIARAASPLFAVMKQYLLGGINIIVMATMAFALSSIARSSALAIGISMLSLLSGSIIITVLGALGFDWARYLIFANLNLANVYNGTGGMFPNQSFPLAVFIVVMHIIIFFMIAWDGFTRKEV